MNHYPHLASRVFNTPLLIHPQKLDAIVSGLGQRLLGSPLAPVAAAAVASAEAPAPAMFSTRKGARAERGYMVTDGVAVLGVQGALVHRSQFVMADSSFLLGYNQIAADLEDAMGNADVHAVLLAFDSPGGEVAGAFELAERMQDMSGRKPMRAIADNLAASAAYLAASAADEVAITSTAYAGSIGVVMRHVDFSRALQNDGVAVTHIFAGDHKVDGNPYEPLPKEVRAALQADVEGLYTMFVDAVAKHRGIEAEQVRGTRAAVFRGAAAVDARLADRVATADQLLTELAALRGRSYPAGPGARVATALTTGASMSGNSQEQGGAPSAHSNNPAASSVSAADIERARAEGAQGERARVTAILGHALAAAHMPLALQCIATGLSADQSTAILGAAGPAASAVPAAIPAAAAAAAGGGEFARAMAAIGNPAVSGVEGAAPQAEQPGAVSATWDRAFRISPAGR
ncbi:S49 family peptidase [Pseudacidovorax sp. RU35E]|uniref:S49 family peptidase n=1 Tax=Pseudacidovorax sp. RU35E TaxID=1907403 RepID=UPI0009541F4C|nr:S49 family peptidase [Pseudacidovorax sp. RU35E]SIQ00922.1 protein C Serine peptidase. MEROPS family S49 [Pseudacidovorax sp. RU35E]